MTHIGYLILPSLTIFALAWFAFHRARRDYIHTCEDLLAKLPEDILANLRGDIATSNWVDGDSDYWRASSRLQGVIDRWKATFVLVQLCQAAVTHQRIEPADFVMVMRDAAMQSLIVTLAFPEVVWSKIFGVPHIFARLSGEYLISMLATAHTLLSVNGAPSCLDKLSAF